MLPQRMGVGLKNPKTWRFEEVIRWFYKEWGWDWKIQKHGGFLFRKKSFIYSLFSAVSVIFSGGIIRKDGCLFRNMEQHWKQAIKIIKFAVKWSVDLPESAIGLRFSDQWALGPSDGKFISDGYTDSCFWIIEKSQWMGRPKMTLATDIRRPQGVQGVCL